MFTNRQEAGRRLAQALLHHSQNPCCVLALPRGGVPVALEIALVLKAPLDLVMVRKLGAPGQPELAIGAVVDGEQPQLVLNEDIVALLAVSLSYIQQEQARQLQEIERRRQRYLQGRPPLEVVGRVAILVDDGIATGATMRAAVRAVRIRRPAQLVLAVPVAPTQTLAELRREVDEVICLEQHEDFTGVGAYYRNFNQVEDEEMLGLLARAPTANTE
jgi:putative phosphoribosyl transferase